MNSIRELSPEQINEAMSLLNKPSNVTPLSNLSGAQSNIGPVENSSSELTNNKSDPPQQSLVDQRTLTVGLVGGLVGAIFVSAISLAIYNIHSTVHRIPLAGGLGGGVEAAATVEPPPLQPNNATLSQLKASEDRAATLQRQLAESQMMVKRLGDLVFPEVQKTTVDPPEDTDFASGPPHRPWKYFYPHYYPRATRAAPIYSHPLGCPESLGHACDPPSRLKGPLP